MSEKDNPVPTVVAAVHAKPAQAAQQGTPDTVYVSFSAEIDVKTTESLISVLTNLINKKVKHVYFLLSTPGGSVMHGITLYNFLRAVPFKLTMHNIGSVNSIGNPIFLAADERYACEHSTFMFHGVALNVHSGQQFEEKRLKESLDTVQSDNKRIGAIIQSRTRFTEEKLGNMFREQATIAAQEAATLGIVNEVRDAKIPDGSTVVSFVFDRKSS